MRELQRDLRAYCWEKNVNKLSFNSRCFEESNDASLVAYLSQHAEKTAQSPARRKSLLHRSAHIWSTSGTHLRLQICKADLLNLLCVRCSSCDE